MLDTGNDLYFFPGIEIDRSTESVRNIDPKDPYRSTLTDHLDDVLHFHRANYFKEKYGFTSFFVPVICVNETRMLNAMNFVRTRRPEGCKFLKFKYLPDLVDEQHLPKPSGENFLSPWKQVTTTGIEDFSF